MSGGGSAKARKPDPDRKKDRSKRQDPGRSQQQERAGAANQEDTQAAAAKYGWEVAEFLTPSPEEYKDLAPLTLDFARSGIAFLDVQDSLERYRDQEGLLAERDRGVPCVHLADEVPLPVSVIAQGVPIQNLAEELREDELRLDELLADTGETSAGEIHEHEHDEARGFLRERLGRFLAFRFLAATLPAPAGSPPQVASPSDPGSPGLPFTVETPKRTGLKILSSPAYFREPRQFGHTLSTPVPGWMLPGDWIFATKGANQEPNWYEDAVYEVPGTTDVALLQ